MQKSQTLHVSADSSGIQISANRTYKSRIFEMIFSDKSELLQLYNAMNGTDYTNTELLEINTLENAIYMSMHNDVSFIIDSRLTLYEHQSTYSPNLPLRCLFYVSDLYSDLTKDANVYGSKLIALPTPKFVIFYNGVDPLKDVQTLKLSDAFMVREDEYSLELTATILNINPGHNPALLNACKTLRDYSEYSARVRLYAQTMTLEAAVELAIDECIENDILAEFLRKNRAEAIKVSIYEYDEEKHIRQVKEEGRLEGRQEGILEAQTALVRRMKQRGLSLEEIADLSGITIKELQNLNI